MRTGLISAAFIILVIVLLLIFQGPVNVFFYDNFSIKLFASDSTTSTSTIIITPTSTISFLGPPTATNTPTATNPPPTQGPTRTLTPSPTSAFSPTPSPGPGIGTPFGNVDYPEIVLHQVKQGESYFVISEMYDTNLEVIQRLNVTIEGANLWSGTVLVILPGRTDHWGLPKFEVIQLERPTKLSALTTDLDDSEYWLRTYNSLGDSDWIPEGRWIIVPIEMWK